RRRTAASAGIFDDGADRGEVTLPSARASELRRLERRHRSAPPSFARNDDRTAPRTLPAQLRRAEPLVLRMAGTRHARLEAAERRRPGLDVRTWNCGTGDIHAQRTVHALAGVLPGLVRQHGQRLADERDARAALGLWIGAIAYPLRRARVALSSSAVRSRRTPGSPVGNRRRHDPASTRTPP